MPQKEIFRIEIFSCGLDMDDENPYPRFPVYRLAECLFDAYEKAAEAIHKISDEFAEREPPLYRLFLRQLALDHVYYNGDFIKLWVFNHKGEEIDRSLCANWGVDKPENIFRGRPENLVRFKPGDIVEWLNGNEARLGVVYSTPLPPEEAREIAGRLERRGAGFHLDWSDDSYTIIDGPDYMASHEHVFSPFVSSPTFPVPEDLRLKLLEDYNALLEKDRK